MLAVKRLGGFAPEVNLRNPLRIGEKAQKVKYPPYFETLNRCHWKSKTGVSVVLQKHLLKKFENMYPRSYLMNSQCNYYFY